MRDFWEFVIDSLLITFRFGCRPREASRLEAKTHEAEAKTHEAEAEATTHEAEAEAEAEARFFGLEAEARPRGLTSLPTVLSTVSLNSCLKHVIRTYIYWRMCSCTNALLIYTFPFISTVNSAVPGITIIPRLGCNLAYQCRGCALPVPGISPDIPDIYPDIPGIPGRNSSPAPVHHRQSASLPSWTKTLIMES